MTNAIPQRGGAASKAPTHLEAPEKALWRDLTTSHDFADAASQSLLTSTLEAHMRARRCRIQIATDGETISDRFGIPKAHPLLAAERDARRAFQQGMKQLNLDLAGTTK